MNRHERRKAKAQQPGKPSPLPPGYIACCEKLAELIPEWLRAQPRTPDLRFHDWGRTIYSAPLKGPALRYLADSPDAFRLLEWLDEQTGGEATLFQAKTVLDLLKRQPATTVRTSAALKHLEHFAHGTFEPAHVPVCPCPYCGAPLDSASPGDADVKPEPGMFGVCARCSGFLQYQADLTVAKPTAEVLAALPADFRSQLDEMAALMQAARLRMLQPVEPNAYRARKVEA